MNGPSTTQTTPPQAPQSPPPRATRIGACGRLAYGVMCLAGLVLAVTGVGTFLAGKAPMNHWVLMAHASAAPLFALSLAAVALTWPGNSRFGDTASQPCCLGRVWFWLILLAGLVVLLSGVVPMTPLFGTNGQHTLYLTHRYSAIVLTGAMILHLLTLASRPKTKE